MTILKKIFTNTRVIVLLVFLLLSLVAIRPSTEDGVAIRGVMKDGPAFEAGMQHPKPTISPTARERIISLDGKQVYALQDYYDIVKTLKPNTSIVVETSKQAYRITPQYAKKTLFTNETIEEIIEETYYNETLGKNVTLQKKVSSPKKEILIFKDAPVDLGLSVQEAPSSNLRKGLDLQGGTRVLLQPEKTVSPETISSIIANLEQRLNVYGVSDVTLRAVTDFDGNQFIVVEVAGTTEEEIKQLLASQGKFEAKVGNKTVFMGGNDITYVCRTADCSGIDPSYGCKQGQGGVFCRFFFSIALSPTAAQRQADATQSLQVIAQDGDQYLSEKLELYLDDVLVDSLNIGADLKGRAVSDIAISGGGAGATQDDARTDALANMKRLQTVLVTGSLPVKLTIAKTDTISPTLGAEFSQSILFMTLFATVGILVVIYLKYRKAFITLPIAITLFSEILIILGAAALIGWNLDLAAIAGIIVAIGTGVDDQIVITDETLRGEREAVTGWKQKLKKAFFIIMAAYFTTVASMLPLLFAGAGLLKGFAITTILGVSIGVFITRPAYAAMLEILLRHQEEKKE